MEFFKPVRGTDYRKFSPSRSLYIPMFGIYSSNLLTFGNSKLAKNVLIFDLLAGFSCPNCKDCVEKCYARKIENLRPAVYNKHAINYELALNYSEFLKKRIIDEIKISGLSRMRIHSSGDFFSQNYVNMWDEIIGVCENVRFYFYTKTEKLFDFSSLLSHGNVNMVRSVLPDGSINFGNAAYIAEKAEKFGIPVCPYGGNDKSVKLHCGSTCSLCFHSPFMLFNVH